MVHLRDCVRQAEKIVQYRKGRTLVWLTALLLAATLNAGADNDADKAFQEMSASITRAKSFACSFKSDEMMPYAHEYQGSYKGTIAVAQGNKVRFEMGGRFEMAGQHDGGNVSLKWISNGTRMLIVESNEKGPVARQAPKNLAKEMLIGMARGGIFVTLQTLEPAREGQRGTDLRELLQISGLKLGKKDRVNGREAQIIEYVLSPPRNETKLHTTLWVDTKSHMPLKRLLTDEDGKGAITVTETYSNVVVDGKVDPKSFELPK